MDFKNKFKNKLFLANSDNFEQLALELFQYQISSNNIYRKYVQFLGLNIQHVKTLKQIPFLPIEMFKNHKVISGDEKPEVIFTSSGTSGNETSKHYVSDLHHYRQNFIRIFNHFYNDVSEYVILALLPSYLERKGSSLVYMLEEMIKLSGKAESGFYLNNLEDLYQSIRSLTKANRKFILFGVSFALLDFAGKYQMDFKKNIVMETGGMKGRRKEITREEMHKFLCKQFSVEKIHSEYGMTELLSQAYSKGDGLFECPPWMKVMIRDQRDPLSIIANLESGCINIIDLANIDSCAFIATQDLGVKVSDSQFSVIGRSDSSDIRGCNLMI